MQTRSNSLFTKQYGVLRALLYILCLSIFSWQCCPKFPKTQINKPVKAPVGISFLDANRLLNTQVAQVKITLIDEEGQVVTPNNLSFTTLEVRHGALSLALKETARFSTDNPYRFTLKTEAIGYITNFRSIVITSDTAQYVAIFMVKVEDPPPGMAGFTGNIALSGGRTPAALTIEPKVTNQLSRKVTVVIPEGTSFLSKQKPVDAASVNYNFSYATPRSLDALRTFAGAGGTLITDAMGREGRRIGTPDSPFFFSSSGWMSLQMKGGSQTIDGFSNPVDLNVPIEDSLINPQTNNRFKEGDQITMWSLNDRGVWQEEGQTTVQNGADGLFATMRITHLSDWNLDFKTNVCATGTQINYQNNLPGSVALTAFSEIVYQQDGTPVGLYAQKPRDYDPGSHSFTIINGPQNTDAVCLVYDNPTGPSTTNNIRASTQFHFCNAAATNPLVIDPIVAGDLRKMELWFFVRVSGVNQPLCNNAVFFLPEASCPSSAAYNYAGNLEVVGDKGVVTLKQWEDLRLTCLYLYYGGLNGMGNTISEEVTFVVDLGDRSAQGTPPIPADNSSITGITYKYVAATGAVPEHFLIVIPGGSGGIPIISTCN